MNCDKKGCACDPCQRHQRMPDYQKLLQMFLAVLHGDGGHYECKYGTGKAVNEAIKKHHLRWQVIDTLKELVLSLKSDLSFIKYEPSYTSKEMRLFEQL